MYVCIYIYRLMYIYVYIYTLIYIYIYRYIYVCIYIYLQHIYTLRSFHPNVKVGEFSKKKNIQTARDAPCFCLSGFPGKNMNHETQPGNANQYDPSVHISYEM